jgi:hypothetical protein
VVLVLKDHRDHRVLLDHKVLKDQVDHLVLIQMLLDHKVHKDHRDQVEHKAILVLRVHKVRRV